MTAVRDWQRNRQMWIRILEKQTGEGLEVWNRRLASQRLSPERHLVRCRAGACGQSLPADGGAIGHLGFFRLFGKPVVFNR